VTNAIQLSGYFLSEELFGDAAACLAAAEAVIDSIPGARLQGAGAGGAGGADGAGGAGGAGDAPLSEEVLAQLTWGWGKLHVTRLVAAAERRRRALEGEAHEGGAAALETRDAVPARTAKFGMVDAEKHLPAEVLVPIASHASVCAVLKVAIALLQRVCRAFPLDGACTEHVAAVQDISKAYKSLASEREGGAEGRADGGRTREGEEEEREPLDSDMQSNLI